MYRGTLIAVKDMETSKRFYRELLGMSVTQDFGANAELEGGLFLQELNTWERFLGGQKATLGNHAGELYFEMEDFDAFCKKLQAYPIEYVHMPLEHRWGQRVVRFYDPDHHVIEAAEEMPAVIRRFADRGMSPEQIANRMDVPVEFVREGLAAPISHR